MCAAVAELLEALDGRHGGASDPSSNPSEIFCFYIYSCPMNTIIFIHQGIQLNKIVIIRREYKPEDLFRPEVATNLQLNQKFRPLFII